MTMLMVMIETTNTTYVKDCQSNLLIVVCLHFDLFSKQTTWRLPAFTSYIFSKTIQRLRTTDFLRVNNYNILSVLLQIVLGTGNLVFAHLIIYRHKGHWPYVFGNFAGSHLVIFQAWMFLQIGGHQHARAQQQLQTLTYILRLDSCDLGKIYVHNELIICNEIPEALHI